MSDERIARGLSRRDFAKGAAVVGAGLAAGVSSGAEAKKGQGAPKEEAGSEAKPALRELGKTGLKISEVSLGVMDVKDPAVVEKAIDSGCNYLDTAASYQGGRNEEMLGGILARRRKEVILATKFGQSGKKEKIIASVNTSLKRLRTDVIDVIQVHGAGDASAVKDPAVWEAFDEMKKAGKVRFLGFTTHEGQAEVLKACVETGKVDTVLVAYNSGSPRELTDMMKKAREAGIGIIAMKTLQGAKKMKTASGATAAQKAIRWVLDKPFVDSANVGMTSFEQVEENVKASGMKLTALDRLELGRWGAALAAMSCGRCGECRKCARGVAPVELMRVHMYAALYDRMETAREEFARMGGRQMLAACTGCGTCEKKCPRGMKIRERFAEVAGLLA